MPSVLGDVSNELKMKDHLSGGEIVFYYELPDSEMRIKYENESMKREGTKIVINKTATRIKYGLKILRGVREGDFQSPKDGEIVQLSSDRSSKDYNPAWKTLVKKYRADLIELLAIRVFEFSASAESPEAIADSHVDDEDVEPDEEEKIDSEDAEGNLPKT